MHTSSSAAATSSMPVEIINVRSLLAARDADCVRTPRECCSGSSSRSEHKKSRWLEVVLAGWRQSRASTSTEEEAVLFYKNRIIHCTWSCRSTKIHVRKRTFSRCTRACWSWVLVKALTGSASSQLPSVRIDVIDDCLWGSPNHTAHVHV